MLNVFLTVDVEMWPFWLGWALAPLPPEKSDFSQEVGNYLYGTTAVGSYGLPYQIATLNRHDLKGTFFVESLSADVVGKDMLKVLVALIQESRQEVQLQIHTEWLGDMRKMNLPADYRKHIRE